MRRTRTGFRIPVSPGRGARRTDLARRRLRSAGRLLGSGSRGRRAGLLPRRASRVASSSATELVVAVGQCGDLVLELEDPAYALDADAGRGEVGDLAQQLDVVVGVAAAAAAGTARR